MICTRNFYLYLLRISKSICLTMMESIFALVIKLEAQVSLRLVKNSKCVYLIVERDLSMGKTKKLDYLLEKVLDGGFENGSEELQSKPVVKTVQQLILEEENLDKTVSQLQAIAEERKEALKQWKTEQQKLAQDKSSEFLKELSKAIRLDAKLPSEQSKKIAGFINARESSDVDRVKRAIETVQLLQVSGLIG